MNKFKYKLSMFLTIGSLLMLFFGIMAIIYSSLFWNYMYNNEKLNENIHEKELNSIILKTKIIGGAMTVVGTLSVAPIAKFRKKARTAMKFDEYGRSKGMNSYNDLSVKEQKELDKQRVMEMNKVLPETLIKQMTKSGVKEPDAEIKKLVGLNNVKEKIEEMSARMEFNKKHNTSKITTTNHMVFFGPPGTGKTTVAKIMTSFLYKYGYIKENKLIETNGSFFTSGDAATKADAICQYAYGKVLFIDEAYAMTNSPQGQEAVATIIKQMEDAKDYFVLILAGYKDEMMELINSNPGFFSRIKEYFYFEDYSEEELSEIFEKMANAEGFKVTKEALNKVYSIFEEAKSDKNFGNARTVRNILDDSIGKHVVNIKKGSSNNDFLIEKNDIIYKDQNFR